ncbi:MAG: YkgJ family cysteine cluster protein [Desulfovibrio sp.]|nr:YkgJ family cysteine cluster protein [Desulfovibrio sp.]
MGKRSPEDAFFECKMCGNCCKGSGGIIVSPSDLERLSAFLQLPHEEVIARYGEYSGKKLKIKTGDDGYCIFFMAGRGCTVHPGKPSICRAWPFFRGNLVDPDSLEMAKDFCPGIQKDARHEAFAQAGLDYLKREKLLAKDPSLEANALIMDEV